MFEQLAKQLQKSTPPVQPLYSRLTLSLVIFSIFTGYFLYQQITNQVQVLTYRDTIAAEARANSQISYFNE